MLHEGGERGSGRRDAAEKEKRRRDGTSSEEGKKREGARLSFAVNAMKKNSPPSPTVGKRRGKKKPYLPTSKRGGSFPELKKKKKGREKKTMPL